MVLFSYYGNPHCLPSKAGATSGLADLGFFLLGPRTGGFMVLTSRNRPARDQAALGSHDKT